MESLLNTIHTILIEENELFLPLKKLWHSLSCHYPDYTWDKFTQSVEKDPRFIIHDMPPEDDLLWDDNEMSKLGYFRGPRVGLKVRTISSELISFLMEKKLNELIDVLKSAYDNRDEKTEELEDEYLDVMRETKKVIDSIKPIVLKKQRQKLNLKNRL